MASIAYDQMTIAIRAGDHEQFNRLLPGFDLAEVDQHNATQLMRAINWSKPDMAKALVYKGCGRARMDGGDTALMIAADNPDASGLDMMLPLSDPDAVDQEGKTALMHAASNGHGQCVRRLAPYSNCAIQDKSGHTAVSLAAQCGHAECVSLLLSIGDLPRAARAMEDPLAMAIFYGRAECARLVLARSDQGRVDTSLAHAMKMFGDHSLRLGAPALMVAQARQDTGPLEASVAGALARSRDFFTMTSANKALFKASETGNKRQVRAALKSVAKGTDCSDYFGETPIIRACRSGNLEALKVLLGDRTNGRKSHKQDALGRSAFDICVAQGHCDALDALHEEDGKEFAALMKPHHGKKFGDKERVLREPRLRDMQSWRRSHLALTAIRHSQPAALSRLYSEGYAPPNRTFADDVAELQSDEAPHKKARANLAIFECLMKGGDELVASVLPAMDKSLAYGSATPLMVAIAAGNAQAYEALIEWTPDIAATDAKGWSALHWAALAGDARALSLLMATPGVDLNAQDLAGNTALLFLAKQNHPGLIAMLEGKCDACLANHQGETPLMWAARNQGTESVGALIAWSDIEAKDHAGLSAADHARNVKALGLAEMISGYAASRAERLSLEDIVPIKPASRHADRAKPDKRRL